MIDAEVMRLRKLRNIALRARTLAKALESNCNNDCIFAESAAICWTISRIATGRLRSHPYLKYQQGPSRIRELIDRAIAVPVGLTARRRNRRFSVYASELQRVSREVADARALTWSADLSEALGRAQLQLRRLAKQLDGAAQHEVGAVPQQHGDALEDMATQPKWPYLAI
jgi:hypothetical protein